MILILVDKNLIKCSRFNPTKKTHQMSILEICRKIETGELTLPLYQRDVSWNLEQMVDLFNYQLLGKSAVSPISLNEISNTIGEVPQVSFIERDLINEYNIKNKHLSVGDGQQRCGTNYLAYSNHPILRNVVLDLRKGKFIILKSNSDIKKYQIPIGILLNKDDSIFEDYIFNNNTLSKPECMGVLYQVRTKLREYNYTVNLAEDLSEEEQINWFEVLNNAGSRVTRIQMKFSKLMTKNIDIYKDYTNIYRSKLEDVGLNDLFRIKETEVSLPIASLNPAYEVVMNKVHTKNFTPIPSDVRTNQLCNLGDEDPNKLLNCFQISLNALDSTISFIKDNDLKVPTRIDYITYLSGLFTFRGIDCLNDKELDDIISWYNNVNFTNMSNDERRVEFSNLLEIVNINTLK